jgi:hypothetical protein
MTARMVVETAMMRVLLNDLPGPVIWVASLLVGRNPGKPRRTRCDLTLRANRLRKSPGPRKMMLLAIAPERPAALS